jgi:hypothetical protein
MKAKDFSLDKEMSCHDINHMSSAADGAELMDAFGVPNEEQEAILRMIHGDDMEEDGFPTYETVGATTEMEIISANLGISVLIYSDYHGRYFYYKA